MNTFINREEERKIIEDSIQALSNDRSDTLRAPILSFHGISGIGKTSVVQYIINVCKNYKIRYIYINAPENAEDFSREVIRQSKHNVRSFNSYTNEQLLEHSIKEIKDLLGDDAVVILLDAVDTANQNLVERIATTLLAMINENKLFIVLTSRKVLTFESERMVARNLTPVPLKPFDQKSCGEYFDIHSTALEPEIRNHIYNWTQGYPLAVEVMTKAIIQKSLDPRIVAHQQQLIDLIFLHVIEEKVLVRVKPSARHKYQLMLLLLSIPRRFNLVIMQELIERFERSYKYESSWAYINLSQEMIRETGVLSWNMLKGGFSVETPIRHIYLLKNKIERQELYLEVHGFLTSLNASLATSMSGADHIWYTREYLYHSSFSVDTQNMTQILKQSIQQIIQGPATLFDQFYEEFEQDTELQEQLSHEQVALVYSLLYQHRAQTNLQLAHQTANGEQLDYLREFFYFAIHNPSIRDHRTEMSQILHNLISEKPQVFSYQQLATLAQEERFRTILGQYSDMFAALLQELPEKG